MSRGPREGTEGGAPSPPPATDCVSQQLTEDSVHVGASAFILDKHRVHTVLHGTLELGGTLTEKNIPSEPSVRPGGVQTVKNQPATWETWVQPLGRKDPLEKGKATQSSVLAWRIHV